MATLAQTVKKVRSNDFEKGLLKVVKDNDNLIIDFNTEEQLLKKGIDSEGMLLQHYATIDYAEFKQHLNPAGVTDLKVEGDFHDSFYVNTDSFPVFVDATDEKTGPLVDQYGINIFGLTKQNKSEFNEYIIEDVQNAYRKAVGI